MSQELSSWQPSEAEAAVATLEQDHPLEDHGPETRLLIVIVNYRTPGLVIECLESLAWEAEALPGCRVTVVDNASGDDSVACIQAAIRKERWGRWVTLLPLCHNRGFAFGNNAAIRRRLAADPPCDFVLLLNPDTIVRPGALQALLGFMADHPLVGIAGSRLEDSQGHTQCSAHRAPSIWGELEGAARLGILSRWLARYVVSPPPPAEVRPCDWVSGASMMVRSEVFTQIGLLDEGYFLYYEEVDFCLRARRAGWQVWYVPQARVMHLEGEATGIGSARRPRPAYWFDSRRRYFVKNHGLLYAAGADLARMAGVAIYDLHRALSHRPNLDPPRYFADLLRHSIFVKGGDTGL